MRLASAKVLTTPLIAVIERSRGYSAPFNAPRLACLAAIHVGVFLASVADVDLNRMGTFIALVNVVVQARYKTEWAGASRDAIARTRRWRGY